MKADPFQIGDVIKDQKQFIVPIYQRTYAWTKERQLEKFFDSVEGKARERLSATNGSYPHYMGAILLNPRGKFSFGVTQMYDVVDGQQRLTTYQIFLAALRDLARENGFATLADQISPFIINTDTRIMKDTKNEKYKLRASKFDRALFRDLVDHDVTFLRENYSNSFYKNGKLREKHAPLPLRAWWYFRAEADQFAREEPGDDYENRLAALSASILEDFRVIVITLDEQDDAQVIFETLNSGGEPLAAMDLVRNDVFHRAIRNEEDVEALMERKWSIFEDAFWKEEATHGRIRKPRIDFFLAHTLTAETGKEVLLGELYARYTSYVANARFSNVIEELSSLVKYAPTYRLLANPTGKTALADLARQLQRFDMSTAYPLVFVIANSDADEQVKATLYKAISSYIVRRVLCGLTAKNYNNTFIRLSAHLRANGVSSKSFSSAFSDTDGDSVRFPTDEELRTAILERVQYGAMSTSILNYILCELEKISRGKFDETTGLRTDLTIEHVLPQDWAEHWPLPDGSKAPLDYVVLVSDLRHPLVAARQLLKHTLGNLTLLTPSGNPKLGNKPFNAIDDALGISKQEALRSSLLKMNQEIAEKPNWDETMIKARGVLLYERAALLWPSRTSLCSALETGYGDEVT